MLQEWNVNILNSRNTKHDLKKNILDKDDVDMNEVQILKKKIDNRFIYSFLTYSLKFKNMHLLDMVFYLKFTINCQQNELVFTVNLHLCFKASLQMCVFKEVQQYLMF